MISSCHPENSQHPITTVNTGALEMLQNCVKLSYTTKINTGHLHLKHSCNYFVPTEQNFSILFLQKIIRYCKKI